MPAIVVSPGPKRTDLLYSLSLEFSYAASSSTWFMNSQISKGKPFVGLSPSQRISIFATAPNRTSSGWPLRCHFANTAWNLCGAQGIYVADGSIIPTALGVNPFLTISALGERIVEKMITEFHRQTDCALLPEAHQQSVLDAKRHTLLLFIQKTC